MKDIAAVVPLLFMAAVFVVVCISVLRATDWKPRVDRRQGAADQRRTASDRRPTPSDRRPTASDRRPATPKPQAASDESAGSENPSSDHSTGAAPLRQGGQDIPSHNAPEPPDSRGNQSTHSG